MGEAARFNVLECGRRFGKTTLGIDLLINAAIDGYPVAWFAPSYKFLAEVWRDTISLLAPLAPKINQQEKRIDLLTRGSIDFWSLDQPDSGRGRKYKRAIVDEAGIVRSLEQAWQGAIRPTLADLIGDAWFLGTPKGNGYFHRLFSKGISGSDPAWRAWRLPTVANPTIDPAEIEAARRDMPETAFNQEFLGIPADDGGNPFGLEAIAACSVDGLSSKPPVAYGVDLAKSHDYTVVCGIDDDGSVCVLERWQGNWKQTIRKILAIVGDTPALVDSTGVGDPIVEGLQQPDASNEMPADFIGYNFVGFKFTSPSKQQIMEGLAAAIHQGKIRFPRGWLVNELEMFEYEYRPGGVRYSAPSGLYDDGVCALALAVEKFADVKRYGNAEFAGGSWGVV